MQKEDIYTIPNMLSMTRLALSPYIGYSIIQGNYKVALGVFGVAAITDLVLFPDNHIQNLIEMDSWMDTLLESSISKRF